MHITNKLLAAVFADSSLFCGKEDVIHAIIHHQLVKSGIPPQRIAREQALSGKRVDVALYGQEVNGDFATTQRKPLAAIEVKGGAYGYRNALNGEIDATGYCKDMTTLKAEATKGVECWFMCVDMPELGRAVFPLKVELVSERCAAHGVSFAYYCQGESCFYVSRPREKLAQVPVGKVAAARNNGGVEFLLARSAPKLSALARQCLALLDRPQLSEGRWQFVSFPAQLIARSLLSALADEDQDFLEASYWEQGAHRPNGVVEEQRA